MKVSVKWMQYYAKNSKALQAPIDVLTQKIGAQLGAIEEIENLNEKYHGIVVAKVVSIKDHENSDHLHIVMIDDGNAVKDVARNENGYVQVVCGASNLREGMLVAWLPPGAVAPETVGKEPFTLTARDFRGVISNGMLASARELGLGTDHEGILDIDAEAKPGDDFAAVYELNDYIIDIENKMFTHRPDCFGQLGVAREVAGIQQEAFKSPDWYTLHPSLPQLNGEKLPLTIRNELPELVPRFTAMVMRDVMIRPSPFWLQTYLLRVGVRPISNVVDLTNYYMLLTGQPLHAYDYDKVKSLSNTEPTIVVRYPHSAEKITLLNGKTIEPRGEAIMIATDKQLIGVGGVMGGADTEVDDQTKNIILECATFDMYSIRRTSMAHGLFTDAVSRFNKGQSPLQNLAILAKVSADVQAFADGKVASEVYDQTTLAEREWVHPPVPITAEYINVRLGLHLSAGAIKELLENVEFSVLVDGDNLTVTAPFWRTDIELREDVVEEVGRLYGFDHLPLDLPMRSVAPVKKDEWLELKSRVRARLASRGANEVLTYSFVHGNLFDKVGQDKTQAFQISNAISPDLQYYRLSLTPSLLDRIHANVKAGYEQFALFEMGLVHHKDLMDEQDANVPLEDAHLALVITMAGKAAQKETSAAYYEAKKYLLQLLPDVDGSLVALKDFDFKGDVPGQQMCAPYEPNRSAVIVWNDLAWGIVGEFKSSVTKALKLPTRTAGFEVGLELIRNTSAKQYQPLPRFPKIDQDICLKVATSTPYREVYDLVVRQMAESQPEHCLVDISPIDIYQRADDADHKQITVRVSIASYERTLTDEEVAKLLDSVATAAQEAFHAERV